MGRVGARRPGALAAAVLLAGCHRGAKHGNSYADKVRDAVPQVEAVTGLKFRTFPKYAVQSKAQVRAFLQQQFQDSRAMAELRGQEATYKLLGLLPDTMNVQHLLLDLYTEQTVGFYDPKSKTFYVVDGVPPQALGLIATHELTHALQDQYINLDSLQHAPMDNDHAQAVQAVLEGHAEWVRTSAAVRGGNIAAGMPIGEEQARQAIHDNAAEAPLFAAAPAVLQEEMLFPYFTGKRYVQAAPADIRGAVFYKGIPLSTEQVIDPAKRFGAREEDPVAVRLPPIAGADSVYTNTLGVLDARLFLQQHTGDVEGAARATAGWVGDRFSVYRTPKGNGIAWVTLWDSPVSAGTFRDQLERGTAMRYRVQGTVAADRTLKFATPERQVVISTGTVGGHPAVLFVDAPAGAGTAPLDLGRVTVAGR